MMTRTVTEPVTFSPGVAGEDAVANYWMRQATLRLRREVSWRWHERAGGNGGGGGGSHGDPLAQSLDLTRHADDRRAFFETDVTAAYLSEKIAEPPPPDPHPVGDAGVRRGCFGWVCRELALDDEARFVLALTLACGLDSACGPVVGACQNDASRSQPTLALAQRLWDQPERLMGLADPAHPLWRHGLLHSTAGAGPAGVQPEWDTQLAVPPLVARHLLFPADAPPVAFIPLESEAGSPPADIEPAGRLVAERLRAVAPRQLRVVPLRGPAGADHASAARVLAEAAGRTVVQLLAAAGRDDAGGLRPLFTLAWLRGIDLFLPRDWASASTGRAADHSHPYAEPSLNLAALRAIPLTAYLAVEDLGDVAGVPNDLLYPVVDVPRLTYAGRVACWRRSLGHRAAGLEATVAECSRRFRYEARTLRAVCEALGAREGPLVESDLVAACRAEVPLGAGDLAQQVTPRFGDEELVLPPAQRLMFEEIFRAMKALTCVHYEWGTARAWNEGGISVLFAGPSGTGKTMAAEVLAARLGVPMFRIDLSQVVNKYIGETSKNLKKVFDVADIADTLLFFDECDALFGRRTEVKDAHDRYANQEVSYLLDRMERFKGLAILATNRRKDLDEAFLRRLRYVVDFPLPDVAQRLRIWQQVVPPGVDAADLDFDFLARQFQLAGGHIRSIVFNACLQTAGDRPGRRGAARPALTMQRMILAVKREYEKLNRSVAREQFGPYARAVEEATE